MPTEIRPYLNSFNLRTIDFQAHWEARNNADVTNTVDPTRRWYAPRRLLVPDLRASLQGTLLDWNSRADRNAELSVPDADQEEVGNQLREPWNDTSGDQQETQEISEANTEESTPALGGGESRPSWVFRLPSLFDAESNNSSGGSNNSRAEENKVSMSYTFSPNYNINTYFYNTPWLRPSDLDWSLEESIHNWNGTLALTSRAQWGDWGQLDNTQNFRQRWQASFWLNDELSDSTVLSKKQRDGRLTDMLWNQTLRLRLSPLNQWAQFSASQFQYQFNSRLFQQSYEDYDADRDQYTFSDEWFEWTRDYISSHYLEASLNFKPWTNESWLDLRLSYRRDLDPRPENQRLTFSMNNQWEGVTSRISGGLSQGESDDSPQWDKIQWSLTLRPLQGNSWEVLNRFQVVQLFEYEIEEPGGLALGFPQGGLSLSRTSFVFGVLTGNFTARKAQPYPFDLGANRWVPGTADGSWNPGDNLPFIPQELNLSMNWSPESFRFWRNRIELGGRMESSFRMNLQQLTSTSFQFNTQLNLAISEFLEFSFSSFSRNQGFFRYFPGLSESLFGSQYPSINPLVDLWDSFSFWDTPARERSLFKIQRLQFQMTHHMHDWVLRVRYSAAPKLNTTVNPRRFEWTPSFGIIVEWQPIPEIRAELDYDEDGTWSITREGPEEES